MSPVQVIVLGLLLLTAQAGARPGGAAPADAEPSMLCRVAAQEAASRHRVPVDVMLAITLVETRRRVGGVSGPWPWTLNIAGRGVWFDTRAEALAAAEAALDQGLRSIDLGCFQINHRWHGTRFGSLETMLDPSANADYAARFLADLHAESGDWMTAAGKYHSRTPEHFARYRALVERALAQVPPAPVALPEGRLRLIRPAHPLPPREPSAGPGGLLLPRRLVAPVALVALGRIGQQVGRASAGGVGLGPMTPSAIRPLLSPKK